MVRLSLLESVKSIFIFFLFVAKYKHVNVYIHIYIWNDFWEFWNIYVYIYKKKNNAIDFFSPNIGFNILLLNALVAASASSCAASLYNVNNYIHTQMAIVVQVIFVLPRYHYFGCKPFNFCKSHKSCSFLLPKKKKCITKILCCAFIFEKNDYSDARRQKKRTKKVLRYRPIFQEDK